ncbi:MAG: YafY family transcriptional regulator [Treponema sp.]|nr:YafY family transcriptional regulator [Treponema sp.]
MKIDRILEIIIYLLNHDTVSARVLAEHFRVTVRTIQRDMTSISLAGIPVCSAGGRRGGYSIIPEYKIKNINIGSDEQQMIMKALESLATSYTNDTLSSLIEKYNAVIEKNGGRKVFWDFSVTKENQKVQTVNQMLEEAVSQHRFVSFDYHNASGEKSSVQVEPLAIHYKWYAWYLFAYSKQKDEYRTFKVARMQNVHITSTVSLKKHGDVEKLMKDSECAYYKTCIRIEVHFDKEDAVLMQEYFPDCPVEHLEGAECRIFIDVPAKERLWKALLLSFGDKVYVTAPEEYRSELLETARKFVSKNTPVSC